MVGGVTFAGITDCQAVVPARRKLEFNAGHEVGQFLVEVDRTAFVWLAAQHTVFDFIVLNRAGPTRQVVAVQDGLKARVSVLGQNLVGLIGRNLADRDIPPEKFVIMCLKLNRAAGRDRHASLPVVLEQRMVDDELVVQVDRRPCADLDDPECVPLADGVIGADQGIFPGRARAVVPQTA